MRELRSGVWNWQSRHPDWNDEQWWPELVSSSGIEGGDDFLLFDPLSVPDELRERATAVVLTAPYHERDADFGDGPAIQLGGRKHVTHDDVRRRLRPLLDLPIELVLLSHGEPTDREGLERVLS